MTIKTGIGKLKMKRTPREVVTRNEFDLLPAGFDHMEALASLARHHRDPFDRLIIATAKVEELTIVTSDRQFWRYDVSLIDARQ